MIAPRATPTYAASLPTKSSCFEASKPLMRPEIEKTAESTGLYVPPGDRGEGGEGGGKKGGGGEG